MRPIGFAGRAVLVSRAVYGPGDDDGSSRLLFEIIPMDTLLGLALGIGLAAACGFRVFVPLLVLSLSVRAGAVGVADNMAWVGSDAAMIALVVATVVEIVGYYVPWVDNMLDTVATPAAVIAGVLATASLAGGLDPFVQWAIAIIGGGGAAASVQLSTVLTRAASTLTTAGVGNPVVSTAETGAATGLSLMVIFLPLLALLVMLLVAVWVVRRLFFGRRVIVEATNEHV